MDGARQALRWSIPGFIFVLEVYVLSGVWVAARGQNPLTVAQGVGTASALATVFAGVPLGFLLYQLYYRNYRPLGRSIMLVCRHPLAAFKGRRGVRSKWTFARRDRGADILRVYYQREGTREFVRRAWSGDDHLHESLHEVTEHRRIFGRLGPTSMRVLTLSAALHDDCTEMQPISCNDCRKRFRERVLFNWGTIIAMIDYASNTPLGSSIRSEYAAGSDIYHALGAARTAVATAAIGTIGYNLLLSDTITALPLGVVPVTAVAVIAYVQYQVLHSARESTSDNLTIRTAASLAWYSRLSTTPESIPPGHTTATPAQPTSDGLQQNPAGNTSAAAPPART